MMRRGDLAANPRVQLGSSFRGQPRGQVRLQRLRHGTGGDSVLARSATICLHER